MSKGNNNSKYQNRNKKSSYGKNNNYKDGNSHRSGNYHKKILVALNKITKTKVILQKYRKNKNTETIADIKLDIERIEKEIRLEIKEIKSLKLGV